MITSIAILIVAAVAFALWRFRLSPETATASGLRVGDKLPVGATPTPPAPTPEPAAPDPAPNDPDAKPWVFVAGDDPAHVPPTPPANDPRRFAMTILFQNPAAVGVGSLEVVGTAVESDSAASLIADSVGGEFTFGASATVWHYYAIAADRPRYLRAREVRGDGRGPWVSLGDATPFLRPVA